MICDSTLRSFKTASLFLFLIWRMCIFLPSLTVILQIATNVQMFNGLYQKNDNKRVYVPILILYLLMNDFTLPAAQP